MTQRLTTLPNGLRVLTDSIDSVESVALGAYFGVGTRNEDMAENGIAHLVEHMMFKGTTTRTARQIVEEIEGVGGQMNAYTGREVTGYHFHVLRDHVGLALTILADMLQFTTLDESELERERQVILQEIGMVADTPDDLVFDYYQARAYPNQSLGTPILGTAEIVSNIPRATIARYIKDLYTPQNLVISAAGPIDHDSFVADVARLFASLPPSSEHAWAKAAYQGGEVRTPKDLEQAHVILGFRGVARTDPNYYNAVALAHILGGGMSSRLFQTIREERGLVYSIYAFHSALRDDGQFAVYAGTDPERLDELMSAVGAELQKIKTTITDVEINRTRAQLKANLLMGREGMTTRADQNAKYMLFHNQILDTNELRRRIDTIDRDKIMALSAQIFATSPTLSALGPIDKLPSFDVIKESINA
jgi:predicted Zn-dependent peptidase